MEILSAFFVAFWKAFEILVKSPYFYLFICVSIICYGHYKICKEIRDEYQRTKNATTPNLSRPTTAQRTSAEHHKTSLECLGSAITLCYIIFKRIFKLITTLHLSITGTSKYIFDKDSPLVLDNYSRMKIILFGIVAITIPLYLATSASKTVIAFSNKDLTSYVIAGVVAIIIFIIVYMSDRTILSYPNSIDICNAESIITNIDSGKSDFSVQKITGTNRVFLASRLTLALSTSTILILLTYITLYSEDILKQQLAMKGKKEIDIKTQTACTLANSNFEAFKKATEKYIKTIPAYYKQATRCETIQNEIQNPSIYYDDVSFEHKQIFAEIASEQKELTGQPGQQDYPSGDPVLFNYSIRDIKKNHAEKIQNHAKTERRNEANQLLIKEKNILVPIEYTKKAAYDEALKLKNAISRNGQSDIYNNWLANPNSLESCIRTEITKTIEAQKASTEESSGAYLGIKITDVLAYLPDYFKDMWNNLGASIFKLIPVIPVMSLLILYELLPIISKICFRPSSYEKAVAFQSILTSLPFELNILEKDTKKIYDEIESRNDIAKGMLYESIAKLNDFEVMQKKKDAELPSALEDFKNAFSSYVQYLSIYPFASTGLAFIVFFSLGIWFLTFLGISSPIADLTPIILKINK